eukprot:NODE_880_length_1267_cov_128.915435_g650_i0.p1 GENE.NODE_880_length_1267_cov_128.915435_g650_i0~~NODE_880_length_1267_cov_128.915435_g650_i0.p1  ORF type:complete len:311 (+),score=88.56 NODE_880_length_1267_cov_128.915435_g650_i0:71-934(+)
MHSVYALLGLNKVAKTEEIVATDVLAAVAEQKNTVLADIVVEQKNTTENVCEITAPIKCGICMEEVESNNLQVFKLDDFSTGNGDKLRVACQHPFCRGCMGTYVTTRITEQRVFQIHCPAEGCANLLFEKDVRQLTEDEVFGRYCELRSTDYRERVAQLLDDHLTPSVVAINANAKLCPTCGVLIERSAGCNSMYCICGAHFSYNEAKSLVAPSVMSMSEEKCISLREASQYNGNPRLRKRCFKLAALSGMSPEESLALLKQATSGDTAAQHAIAQYRATPRVADQL